MSLKALSLPEDILRIIIESSDKFTLRNLLLVSKQIHAFAEPILYRDVYLDVSGFPSNFSLFHTRMTSDSLPSTTVGNQGYSHLMQSRRQKSLSLCVKSFSVEFAAGHDWEDIQLLDSLLPTLLNLESFSLHFHYYDAQIGRFKFLQDAPLEASTSSNMNLRKFSFTSENHEGTIDITPFLYSHPNLEYIQLYTDMLYVDPGDHQLSFPNLKAYGGYLSPRILSQSAAALTCARLPLETEGVPEMPVLSTLSIDSRQEYTFAPLKVILSRARNVKNLEIFDFDARWDFWEGLNEVLDGSNIKHIRIVTDSDSYWNTIKVRSVFARQTDGLLDCIELQRSAEGRWYEPNYGQSPISSRPTSTRWYKNQEDAVVVEWECREEDVWLLDWERDAHICPCSQSDRRVACFDWGRTKERR